MRNLIVAAAVAAACLTSTAFAADETTKVSGKAFIDFTDKSTDGNNAGDGFGVDVTRFYVSVDHNFDDVWAADVTTDFQYSSAVGATELYIKKAYLQAKVNNAFMVRIGAADTPWVPFVEGLYGYRYFEKVMIDRTGFGTSSDWGLHVSGSEGMFSYAVSAVNGRGYKDPTRSKTMDLESRFSIVPVKGLTFAVGFRTGKLGQDLDTNPAEQTASRFDALVAYAGGPAHIGAEYFSAKNYSTSLVQQNTPPALPPAVLAHDKEDGFSVWGSYNFVSNVAGFARVEEVKPNKDTASANKNKFATVGVSYTPRKNVDLAFAFKQTKAETASSSVKSNEIGVWTQVAF